MAQWASFDVAGDPAVARRLYATRPGPEEVPVPEPTPERRVMTVAMWRQGGDLPRQISRALAAETPKSSRLTRRPPSATQRRMAQLRAFARQTPEGLRDSLLAGGFSVACADCYQGTTVQGVFSHTAIDFQNVDDVLRLARMLLDAGIRFWPMVNPRGSEVAAEVDRYAELCDRLAQHLGEAMPLMDDLEFKYPLFFEGSLDDLRHHFGLLQETFGRLGLPWGVVPDPRQPGRDYPKNVLPAVPLFFQIYHKDFGTTVDAVFSTFMRKASWPDHLICPVVQGDASTADLIRSVDLTLAGEFPCLVVWGYGSMVHTADPTDTDDFAALAAHAGPYQQLFGGGTVPPTPQPAPGLDAFNSTVWAALDQIETAVGAFDPHAEPDLVGLREGIRGLSAPGKMLIRATKRIRGLE